MTNDALLQTILGLIGLVALFLKLHYGRLETEQKLDKNTAETEKAAAEARIFHDDTGRAFVELIKHTNGRTTQLMEAKFDEGQHKGRAEAEAEAVAKADALLKVAEQKAAALLETASDTAASLVSGAPHALQPAPPAADSPGA
jgi:hypothetical protein